MYGVESIIKDNPAGNAEEKSFIIRHVAGDILGIGNWRERGTLGTFLCLSYRCQMTGDHVLNAF